MTTKQIKKISAIELFRNYEAALETVVDCQVEMRARLAAHDRAKFGTSK